MTATDQQEAINSALRFAEYTAETLLRFPVYPVKVEVPHDLLMQAERAKGRALTAMHKALLGKDGHGLVEAYVEALEGLMPACQAADAILENEDHSQKVRSAQSRLRWSALRQVEAQFDRTTGAEGS